MASKLLGGLIFLFVLLPFFTFSCSMKKDQSPKILIQTEDAAKLNLNELKGDDWDTYVNKYLIGTRGLMTGGPRIEIKYPLVIDDDIVKKIETHSPTNLNVEFFKGPAGEQVDMSTLEVIGKNGWFKKSLTNKLKPYIRGTKIEASNIKIGKGKYHLYVSIADMAGVKTEEDYILIVR